MKSIKFSDDELALMTQTWKDKLVEAQRNVEQIQAIIAKLGAVPAEKKEPESPVVDAPKKRGRKPRLVAETPKEPKKRGRKARVKEIPEEIPAVAEPAVAIAAEPAKVKGSKRTRPEKEKKAKTGKKEKKNVVADVAAEMKEVKPEPVIPAAEEVPAMEPATPAPAKEKKAGKAKSPKKAAVSGKTKKAAAKKNPKVKPLGKNSTEHFQITATDLPV